MPITAKLCDAAPLVRGAATPTPDGTLQGPSPSAKSSRAVRELSLALAIDAVDRFSSPLQLEFRFDPHLLNCRSLDNHAPRAPQGISQPLDLRGRGVRC